MTLQPNLLCQADCLTLLERIESGTAQLVYLDPPWFSAGTAFSRSEAKAGQKLTDEQRKVQIDEAFRHYLEWLSKVIQQGKRISSEEGNVVIYTEPSINSYTRVIAERIFGRERVSEIVLRKTYFRAQTRGFPRDEHENLLLCQVSEGSVYNQAFRPLTEKEMERFNHEDAYGRFFAADLTASVQRPSLSYEWKGARPPEGRSWKFTEGKMNMLDAEGRIYYSPTNGRPYLKQYASEHTGVPIGNNWDDLLNGRGVKRTKLKWEQPIPLLERIITTTTNEGGIMVDPFCGSGVALVAAQLNARRWIGGDISDEAISITRERLEREAGVEVLVHYKFLQEEALGEHSPLSAWYSSFSDGLIENPIRFIRNEPIELEETRHYEFKEVKGSNPVSSIENTADEYAVAFLNSEGGRIFWGIRNDDRVTIGVTLNSRQRDDVGKAIDNKLHQIQPSVAPSAWRTVFHQVHEVGGPFPDLYVVELTVPRPSSNAILYATGKGEVFVKTDSGKKKLSFTELQAEVIRRARL